MSQREILFKSKHTKDREWVFGSYVTYKSLHDGNIEHRIIDNIGDVFVVDPETVCQYTGLTDKNGVKIWEGDKLQGWFCYYKNTECYASFQDGAFGIVWMRGKIKEFTAFTSICNVVFEVVGNIYDQEDKE